ncbi:MAG: hypothetical protein HQL73_11070 [Magnetococcales bacterium]|nr:hypothetical protein [Magnetococcales bacterium]
MKKINGMDRERGKYSATPLSMSLAQQHFEVVLSGFAAAERSPLSPVHWRVLVQREMDWHPFTP